jgi:hypothetical protein
VAVGPTIETVLTLTNRGTFEDGYQGELFFWRGSNGAAWNPVINGTPVTEGRYSFTILQDETLALRITGGDVLETGFVHLRAVDLILDNFVEANLTYYIRQGGVVVDSVGVAPSEEVYLAAIPFEQFSTIALALANPSGEPESVPVLITPITGNGSVLPGKTIELGSHSHNAQFLTELFPGVEMDSGKVEISSPRPIVGTALTLVNGQLSSLPLLPSPVAYNLIFVGNAGSGIPNYEGTLALWAEGFFVKGYLVISRYGEQEVPGGLPVQVSGQLADRFLDLSFFAESRLLDGDANNDRFLTIYMGDIDFLFSDDQATGEWLFTYLDDKTTEGGTFTLVRTTP